MYGASLHEFDPAMEYILFDSSVELKWFAISVNGLSWNAALELYFALSGWQCTWSYFRYKDVTPFDYI